MKIILLENVKGTGKKDEVKDVKDGFGSFLIKSKKAVMYSSKSNEVLNTQLQKREDEHNKLVDSCIKLKNKLENIELEFDVKTGKDGKVFGSISSKQISELLSKKGFDIDKKYIKADNLNTLGSHIVLIELHKEVKANLSVLIKGGE